MLEKEKTTRKRVLPKKLTSKGLDATLPEKSSTPVSLIIKASFAVIGILFLVLVWWCGMLLFLLTSSAFLAYQAGLDWKKIKMFLWKMVDQCWKT